VQSTLPLDHPADDIPAQGSELPGLTGIVPVLDEEQNLEACITSFAEICDEIIVVDSGSRDRTVEIARRFTDRVYVRPWVDYRTFLKFAMPRARRRWLLVVDADERLTPSLRKQIRERVEAEGEREERTAKQGPQQHGDTPGQRSAGAVGFRMKRSSHFLGRRIRYSGWQNDFVYRFFRKGKGGPREREVHPGIVIDGPIEPLDGLLLHFPYPTLEDYFAKFNRYTSAAARDRLKAGKRVRWSDRFLSPPARFLRTYFLRYGFLDGYPGFVLSVLGAFYVFARYTKMWQMQNAEDLAAEMKRLAVLDGRGGTATRLRPPTH
jgi:glycosyltransferase involved in cell wall biosynthesis